MAHVTHFFAGIGEGATIEVREHAIAAEHLRYEVRVTTPGAKPFAAAHRGALLEAMQYAVNIAWPLHGAPRASLAVDTRLKCGCDGDVALDEYECPICAHCGRPAETREAAHASA